MKKIIITISIILIVIISGFIIYSLLSPSDTLDFEIMDLVTDNSESTNSELVFENKINIVSPEEILGYSINPATKHVYVVNILGEIKKINNSNSEKVSSQKIKGINKVQSSKDGRKIMIGFNYPNQPVFSIYNITDGNWTPLPKNTISADWHPENSNEIIYLTNNNLKILDLKKNRSRSVLNIKLTGSKLDWVSLSEVIVMERPTTKYSSDAWLINLSTKKIKKIASGKGLMINQKDGWRLRFVYNSKGNKMFSLINSETNRVVGYFNFKTLPSKCVIDQNNFYCAIPNQIPLNISLPNDYLSRKFISDDVIQSIMISSDSQSIESKILYKEGDDLVDATDLKIVNDQLYFINRSDNKLYSLKLDKVIEEVVKEEEVTEEVSQ